MKSIQPFISIKKKPMKVLIWIFFIFVVFEITAHFWLRFIASEDDRLEYSLYTDINIHEQRYIPHQFLNYYPNPEFKKGKTYHNSLGYRNKEFPVKKPDGVFRIVVLGGSTTYTVTVDDNEKTFPARLEQVLREEYGYDNVEVINAGVGGYNSWETLINLQFRVLDIDPDLIIEYEGANDVHARFVNPASYKGDDSGKRKQWTPPSIPILERSAFLRTILRKIGLTDQVEVEDFTKTNTAYGPYSVAKRNPMELLDKNPPIYFRRNLNNMVAISKANNIDIVLVTWACSTYFNDYTSTPYHQRGYEENNEVVREVAKSNGIPLFDFASVMPMDIKYWADGRHVNELGAEKQAELFAEFIHKNGLIELKQ